MIIDWHGQSFFEIDIKNEEKVVLVIDPFAKSLGLKVPKIEADILLLTNPAQEIENIKEKFGQPFLINQQGEYELKGVFVKGIASVGGEETSSIIYKIEGEGMKICHLGMINQKELTPQQLEEIGEVDILMVPVGGRSTLSSKTAADIISQIEPKLIIPMCYKIPQIKLELESLDNFLKVEGIQKIEPQKRLKISLKDLPKEEAEIIVLSP